MIYFCWSVVATITIEQFEHFLVSRYGMIYFCWSVVATIPVEQFEHFLVSRYGMIYFCWSVVATIPVRRFKNNGPVQSLFSAEPRPRTFWLVPFFTAFLCCRFRIIL